MRHGFSLVELSIVLVILGLLTGGILGGQALMRAAELRSVTQEFTNYQAAAHTFRDKYFALPGDMPNATAFWQTFSVGTGCPDGSGVGAETCNGDGDGNVNTNNEMYLFWQHMANAGLINGTYTGVKNGADTYAMVRGLNVPQAKLSNGMWAARYYSGTPSPLHMFVMEYGNYFVLGADAGTGSNWPGRNPLFNPEEAWNIDIKVDDGMPATGKLVARSPNGWNDAAGALPRCTTAQTNTEYDANYDLDVESAQCTILFLHAL